MKKIITILVFLAVILFVYTLYRSSQGGYKTVAGKAASKEAPHKFADWMEYTSPSALFKASFPMVPQYTTDVTRNAEGVVLRTNELYASEDEHETVYLISVVRYHTPNGKLPLSSEQIMSNVMYEMIAEKKGNQLIGFSKNQVDGNNGLYFTLVNEGIQMDVQVFTNETDLYLISYIADKQYYNEGDFAHFIESFSLLN